MGAAYPLELRQRVVAYYRKNKCTQPEAAQIFNIGVTTLRSYLRQAEKNSLAPKVYKRGRQRVISGKRLTKIASWVEEKPDIVIKTLRKKYQSYYKQKVSHSMMWRALSEMNYNRKKKSLYAQEQLRPDVKKSAKNTLRNTKTSRQKD
jgi:transposase